MQLPEYEKPEGLFERLNQWLLSVTVEELRQRGPALGEEIPELKPLIGFDQRSPHHAYDLFTHVSHVVAGVPAEPALRWAALLHDIGKIPTFTRDETGRGHFYGHAAAGAEMADAVLRRLEAPDALREEAVQLIGNHMTRLEPEEALRSRLDKLGWETVDKLLKLQEADMSSKGTGKPEGMEQFPRIRGMMEKIREEACLNR